MTTGYCPRPLQSSLHNSLKRFSVVVAHRRFGKTVFGTNHLIDCALRNELRAPRYAYIAPFYRQAKTLAWDYLRQFTRAIPDTRFNEAELRVDLRGGRRITLFGADNPDSLRGMYFDGVVLDEYAHMAPRTWSEVIRPSLSDRNGWALFIGTPCGHNAFKDLYDFARADPAWFAALYRASETGIVPPDELAAARREMGEDHYAQEYECSWEAAIKGSYYAALIESARRQGRIGRIEPEPQLPVVTAWDLGIGDSTAIWFAQFCGQEVRLIDYYEASGVGLDHYVQVLQSKPYIYREHLLPHDVEVKELGTGRSRKEVLESLGLRCRVIPALPVADGIQAVRLLLPRCWIDERRCAEALDALAQYRADWDERQQCFRPHPKHDWTSHCADALRYLAVGYQRPTMARPHGRSSSGKSWKTI